MVNILQFSFSFSYTAPKFPLYNFLSKIFIFSLCCGPSGSVGIATGYGQNGPGIEFRCGSEIFRTYPGRPWGPPSLLYNGYRLLPGRKERPGRAADHSPPSSAVVKKEQSYTSTPPMGCTACTEPQCLYSRAIPLLPLWAVRPVQSLSACTVELYLYSYVLYRASVPVQYSYTPTPSMGRTACIEPQCLYSRAIPLLPLCIIRPVQSLSACTRVHFTSIFTSVNQSHSWEVSSQ